LLDYIKIPLTVRMSLPIRVLHGRAPIQPSEMVNIEGIVKSLSRSNK